jgi:hypothetical protein
MRLPFNGRQRGASLVEFVIVFPVAVLFVLALIQVGFMYMAKLSLNHATFMAARAGALNNARMDPIQRTLIRGLSPFYQDSSVDDDVRRLLAANLRARLDAVPFLNITLLSPSAEAFADFGVRDAARRVTYIPNDNLEWRSDTVGTRSGMNIRDANLLKIRVVYGYELKVPLMATILRWTMCGGGSSAVPAWGDGSLLGGIAPMSAHCLRYYSFGRVPIESFAIVEMQSRPERP